MLISHFLVIFISRHFEFTYIIDDVFDIISHESSFDIHMKNMKSSLTYIFIDDDAEISAK